MFRCNKKNSNKSFLTFVKTIVVTIVVIKLNIGKPFIVTNNKIKNLSPRAAIFLAANEIMLRISKMLPPEKQGYYKNSSSEQFSITSEVELEGDKNEW